MAEAHFKELEDFLSESQILRDQKNLEFYGQDWVRLYKVNPSLIVFPQNAEDVFQLVKWARKHKVALVPSGGRTGLSGAAIASQQEVIVSFEKMNQLIEWNSAEETLTVEAGCITKEVQKWASDRGFLFPRFFCGGRLQSNWRKCSHQRRRSSCDSIRLYEKLGQRPGGCNRKR